jgi:hypothetical protein
VPTPAGERVGAKVLGAKHRSASDAVKKLLVVLQTGDIDQHNLGLDGPFVGNEKCLKCNATSILKNKCKKVEAWFYLCKFLGRIHIHTLKV